MSTHRTVGSKGNVCLSARYRHILYLVVPSCTTESVVDVDFVDLEIISSIAPVHSSCKSVRFVNANIPPVFRTLLNSSRTPHSGGKNVIVPTQTTTSKLASSNGCQISNHCFGVIPEVRAQHRASLDIYLLRQHCPQEYRVPAGAVPGCRCQIQHREA